MTKDFVLIAKAEYLVSSVNYRANRTRTYISLLIIGCIWMVLAPIIVPAILANYLPDYNEIVLTELPGISRQYALLIWLVIFIMPISGSLEEIKVTEWEFILSTNVSTRDILIGKFIGRFPHQLLLFLFVAPIFLSPIFSLFQISIVGMSIMYGIAFILIFSTLWISVFVAAVIKSKLTNSTRGDDIAKVTGTVISILLMLPIMLSLLVPDIFAQILTSNLLLAFPFTWCADIISWVVLIYSGIEINSEALTYFHRILVLDISTNIVLILSFSLFFILIEIYTADRVFAFSLSAQNEGEVTVGPENIVIRGIRSVFSYATGTLVVTQLKDFFRKPKNVVTIALASILSSIPLVLFTIVGFEGIPDIPFLLTFISLLILSFMYPLIGGVVFGLSAMLENRNQLWIIRSAPDGAFNYIKARLFALVITSLPMVLIPSISMVIFEPSLAVAGFLLVPYALILTVSSTMIGLGVSTMNPVFEDSKSVGSLINFFVTFALVLVPVIVVPQLLTEYFVATIGPLTSYALLTMTPLTFFGLVFCWMGIQRFEKPD